MSDNQKLSSLVKNWLVKNLFERERPQINPLLMEAQRLIDSGAVTERKIERLLLVIEYGQRLGVSPIIAATNIKISKNRIIVNPILIRALIMNMPDLMQFNCKDDGKESCVIISRSKLALPVYESFSNEEAEGLGCFNRRAWQAQPKKMREERALMRAARSVYPHLMAGVISPDESFDELNARKSLFEKGIEWFKTLWELDNSPSSVKAR